ncbi:NAD(P)/FAD-dependent oxidoreductase [Acidihalobacter ferrooxydans]|uniref:FAD-dependent oxidoreductase n=1 Tax=Acidihalobacter ferrooxydans TaxID=1765967 RepID=A0A1P8UDW4_9GAMM|nr:NAD(P)/FAD-dependent oxidoreductase [Acidihalobacter ferrooxydans]APZ42010.1 FAD-dependent oxidoreductase [Acidihalobacter ferrooxydans]
MSTPHRIVIVGGGAAGLELATRLGNRLGKRKRASITLIDAQRTHLWKPLLHEVAAGTLDPAEHAITLLGHARRHHMNFRIGSLESIDRTQRRVWLAPNLNEAGEELIPRRDFAYDTLVIAVGSVSNDFHTPGVAEHCWFLDSLPEAQHFQHRLLEALLRAGTHKPGATGDALEVVIVGGGATGVELAAQMHHVARQLTQYGFDELDPEHRVHLSLFEAGSRILPALPERLSRDVTAELEGLGVRVHVDKRVTEVTREGIHTADGEFMPAAIKVWAAGIRAPDCLDNLDGLETNRNHQLAVRRNLLTTLDDSIFAIGDCADFPPDAEGRRVPPRAQTAHQQASFVARAIERRLRGREDIGTYVYRDYGSLVTLGHYSTVGSLMGSLTGSVWISGFVARVVYLSLHKMHQVALHGWLRTLALTLANLLRRSVNPEIKLH